MGVLRWGRASCPSSIDRQSRVSRDVPPVPRGGVRLDPGSESGVTNDRQSRVLRGTVPPVKLLSRGPRDFTPRNGRVSNSEKIRQPVQQPELLDSKVSVFLQEANRLLQGVSAEWLRQDFGTSIDNRVDNRGLA